MALVGMFAMTTQAEENVQATEKSAAEQHQEAIAAQTQRWIEETRNGVPSKERMDEIIASNVKAIRAHNKTQKKHIASLLRGFFIDKYIFLLYIKIKKEKVCHYHIISQITHYR